MLLAANQFSTEHSGSTSTGTLLANNLPFTASRWEVRNTGTLPVRFSLASTSPTTGDLEIGPGVTREFAASSSKFSVLTTSTSTDGRDLRRVSVRGLEG